MMPAEVCEYPDSGKVGAFGGAGTPRLRHMTAGRSAVDYWKDEDEPAFRRRRCEQIEREATKYPPEQRQSAVMSALAIAQDEHGWLSNEVMEEVAKVLGMPPVAVYEVATFYAMYNLKPAGTPQGHGVHQPAVRALGRRGCGRAPEEEARRGVQRDHAPTAASR